MLLGFDLIIASIHDAVSKTKKSQTHSPTVFQRRPRDKPPPVPCGGYFPRYIGLPCLWTKGDGPSLVTSGAPTDRRIIAASADVLKD